MLGQPDLVVQAPRAFTVPASPVINWGFWSDMLLKKAARSVSGQWHSARNPSSANSFSRYSVSTTSVELLGATPIRSVPKE